MKKRTARLFAMAPSAVLLLASAASTSTACSSSSPSSGGGGDGNPNGVFGVLPVAGPDVDPPADVKLQPDVVIVHGGASVLHGVSDDHTVWTLDKGARGVADLAPGKVLLIAGLDVARVTAIGDRGAEIDVTVAPVSITDVIHDGKLSWANQPIDTTKGIVTRGPSPADAPPPDAGTRAPAVPHRLMPLDNSPATGTLEIKLSDNWTFQLAATRDDKGGVDLTITGIRSVGAASSGGVTFDGIQVNASAKLHIANIGGSSGSLSVAGGGLDGADLDAPVDGYIDLDALAKTQVAGQFPAQALLKLPLALQFPFPCWAGIPCYFSVQVSFAIQPSLATKDSAVGVSAHFDFKGHSGLSFNSGNAAATSMPSVPDPDSPLDKATTPPSVGNTAMVFVVQAPRFGLGVGTLSFLQAQAGLFVDVVNSLAITVAGATSLVPCKSMAWNWAAHGGGEMKIKLVGGVAASYEHSFELVKGSKSWASPDIAACKP